MRYYQQFANSFLFLIMPKDSPTGLLFIDVDAKPHTTVKEECASSPDEKLSDVKNQTEKLHCAECGRFTCRTVERMARHIRKAHRGKNPYQCALCEYTTYNSVCFRDHVNLHKGIKPYKCKHCSYRTVSKKYIKMHETKHGSCDKCDFVASNRPALKRHKKEHGCNEETEKIYRCQSCNICYDRKASLKQHKRGHKQCHHCNKSFSPTVLLSHLASEHGIGAVKRTRFKCQQCTWSSTALQKILLHLIHHPQDVADWIDVTPLVKAGILSKSE